jgi:hypothetical protein
MRQTRVLHLAAVPAVLLALTSSSAAEEKPAIQQLFAFTCDPDSYSCANGRNPNSPLQPTDGNFYGTTEFSGTGNAAAGTVFNLYGTTIGASSAKPALFRLTLNGEFDTLHTFIDQKFPNSPPIETASGKLYGAMSVNQDQSAPDTFGSNLPGNRFTQYTVGDMNYPTSTSDGSHWGSKLAGGGSDYPNGVLFSYSKKGNALSTVQFCGAERNEAIRQ